jgi:hypothetical protein
MSNMLYSVTDKMHSIKILKIIEKVGLSGSPSTWCSEDAGFESRPEHRLF